MENQTNENNPQSENKSQNNYQIDYNGLLKYPVITLCIVLGIIGLSKFAGIEFSKVTKFSADGIEFESSATKAVEELDLELTQLKIELDSIKSLNSTGLRSSNSDLSPQELQMAEVQKKSNKLQQTERASSSIARLNILNEQKNKTSLKGKTGFVWLGAYNETSGWLSDVVLKTTENGTAIKSDPNSIPLSQQYQLAQNVRMRELPSDNNDDFIGIVPKNTTVLLQSISGPDADNQYWANIEVVQ